MRVNVLIENVHKFYGHLLSIQLGISVGTFYTQIFDFNLSDLTNQHSWVTHMTIYLIMATGMIFEFDDKLKNKNVLSEQIEGKLLHKLLRLAVQ